MHLRHFHLGTVIPNTVFCTLTEVLPSSASYLITALLLIHQYELCLTLLVLQMMQMTTMVQPSKGGLEGIKKVFATVGLGSALQPQLAHRAMLSQDLFESTSLKDSQSCRSSQVNGQGLVVPPPPEAHLHETKMMMMTEVGKAPLKNLLYPFLVLVHKRAVSKNNRSCSCCHLACLMRVKGRNMMTKGRRVKRVSL
jgi:hypothetical protein